MTDLYPKSLDEGLARLVHACENAAKHLERIELLMEHASGAHVEYDQDSDPHVVEKEIPPHA